MKVIAQKTYLIATAVGNMKVVGQLITDYDIDSLTHLQAISQAELVRMANIGREIDANANLPQEVIPSIFKNTDEVLDG